MWLWNDCCHMSGELTPARITSLRREIKFGLTKRIIFNIACLHGLTRNRGRTQQSILLW